MDDLNKLPVWKRKGVLYDEHLKATQDRNAHTTALTIEYRDITRSVDEYHPFITSMTFQYPWNILSSADKLPVPKGYSTQYFDYRLLASSDDALSGLNKSRKLYQGNIANQLGIVETYVKHHHIYAICNIVPAAGLIKFIFVNSENEPRSVLPFWGKIGTPFHENRALKKYAVGFKNPYKDKNSGDTTESQIVYSQGDISTFTRKEQDVFIETDTDTPEKKGHVPIYYQLKDGTPVNGVYWAEGYTDTDFNLDDYDDQIPKGYELIKGYNPNMITKFEPLNKDTPAYFIVSKIDNTEYSDIAINFEDETGEELTEVDLEGVVGKPFSLLDYIAQVIPKYQDSYVVSIKNDVPVFTDDDQTVTVIMRLPPQSQGERIQNVSPIAHPGSAYILFIDEDNDSSRNPSTYNSNLSSEQQANPRPLTNVITRSNNPVMLPDLSHVNFSDLTYNGQSLSDDSEITGPDLYWEPYLFNEQYSMLYLYEIDTSKPPHTEEQNSDVYIIINCYPAYVKGITFQFGSLDRYGHISHELTQAPSGHQVYYPKGWLVDKDPLTGNDYFDIPYGTSISAYALTNTLYGGDKGEFHDNNGTNWRVVNDRAITFRTPYSYQIGIRRLD